MSKYHKNGKPKNEISGSEELFFDFRGMILTLLVFDNQEYCIFIDIFLSLVLSFKCSIFVHSKGHECPSLLTI